ncbi:hypothetical protein ACWDVX_11855 [Streptomyces tendae]
MSGLKNGAEHGNFSTVDAEVSNTQLTDVMAHAGIQFASWLMFEGFGANCPGGVRATGGTWIERTPKLTS